MKTLILIGCGKTKRPEPCPAKDLYTGHLFRLAREYAESTGHPWAILSAGHHLVFPDQILSPYDTTLTGQTKRQRLIWSDITWRNLRLKGFKQFGRPQKVIFLAGNDYREFLDAEFNNASPPIPTEAPLAGLGIGQQKKRLKEMIEALQMGVAV